MPLAILKYQQLALETTWAERWEERLAMVEADPVASASGGLVVN